MRGSWNLISLFWPDEWWLPPSCNALSIPVGRLLETFCSGLFWRKDPTDGIIGFTLLIAFFSGFPLKTRSLPPLVNPSAFSRQVLSPKEKRGRERMALTLGVSSSGFGV